jgi:polygalacturonase
VVNQRNSAEITTPARSDQPRSASHDGEGASARLFWNVRDFGAAGNGSTKDTAAIQKTIDDCARAGGGRVILPGGRYLSGTIHLKSHIELYLSAGAVLLGSGDREDYNADDIFAENRAFATENVTATHLIVAYGREDVAITGPGAIDGNAGQFFGPLPQGAISTYRFKNADFPIKAWRPGQMVFFCRCRNVRVCDVALINSPYWTLFLLGCEDVRIRGLKIENPPATRNGDGIDIDCCRNVTISDCIIRSGDDSITLRANNRLLGEEGWPCENVVVSNCILSSPCNAIRVGVGDGLIRRCSFSNIVVAESSRAVNFVSRYGSHGKHGAAIEQIYFSDFVIDACMPLSLHIGPSAIPPAGIRDIGFSRFHITASAGSNLIGLEQAPLERIRLSDFDWCIRGGTDNCELVENIPDEFPLRAYVGEPGELGLPCVIYGRHLHGAAFENIRIRWENPSRVWREGLRIEKSRDIDMQNIKAPPPPERRN